MQSVSNANFGPLIAYLVPGATALWAMSEFSPTIRSWFAMMPPFTPYHAKYLAYELEQQRNQEKRTLFDVQDQIERRKDSLISEVEARLQQQTSMQNVFTIRWGLA